MIQTHISNPSKYPQLLLTHLLRAQPTTLSEYTFITTGYKAQLESGGKMMSGYILSNCGEWKVDQADATRTVEYKALFREIQASPCAIMIIYKKLEKGKVTGTEYFCVPTLEAVDLWDMTWKHLHEFAAKEQATQNV